MCEHLQTRRGKFTQIVRRNECAHQPEDGSGGSGTDAHRSPPDAGQRSRHARDQVDSCDSPVTIERFAHCAQVPEAPHVEKDVHQANVKEDAGQQTPLLAAESKRPHVGQLRAGHTTRRSSETRTGAAFGRIERSSPWLKEVSGWLAHPASLHFSTSQALRRQQFRRRGLPLRPA
jgi:hypothetical protein